MPAVKVSVVVPVFNPGEHVEDCIASLLRQSLPAGEMEAIFVDDGSTDGTGERLDRLAAEHPDVVRVIHIPNSGWPGRPRNVGVDAAQGEYVLFVDNDDWIGDEALERLYATATRTAADVVVGKVVGRGKKVPLELFRRNIDDARLNPPLLGLLTPHKLFRRAFLAEHGLRFPEGRRRLEDHVLVLQAFFRARRIAVLSDYPTYFWVFHGEATNASQSSLGPTYFADLREVLDIVEANTEPGAFRDGMLRHWYRVKMIGRLGGPTFAWRAPEQRQELYDEVRALSAERFAPSVTESVRANLRVRAALLEAGRLDGLVALAEWETELRLELVPGPARWQDGALRIPLDATLTRQDKRPIVFPRVDGRLRYALPPDLPGAEAITTAGDVTDELTDSLLRVTVRARDTLEEYLLPVGAHTELREAEGGVCVHVVGEAILDPETAAAGTALRSAVWDVLAGMSCCGNTARRRVDAHAEQAPPAALTGRPARIIVPYRTKAERLAVDVDQAATRLLAAARLDPDDVRAAVTGDALELTFGLSVLTHGAGPINGGELVLTSPASEGRQRVTGPARLVPDGDHARFEGTVPFAPEPGPDLVSPGSWNLGGSVGHARPARLHLAVDVGEDGATTVRRGRGRTPVRPAAAEDFTALTRRYRLRRALRNFQPARRTVKRVRWVRNRLLGRPRKRHPGAPRPR